MNPVLVVFTVAVILVSLWVTGVFKHKEPLNLSVPPYVPGFNPNSNTAIAHCNATYAACNAKGSNDGGKACNAAQTACLYKAHGGGGFVPSHYVPGFNPTPIPFNPVVPTHLIPGAIPTHIIPDDSDISLRLACRVVSDTPIVPVVPVVPVVPTPPFVPGFNPPPYVPVPEPPRYWPDWKPVPEPPKYLPDQCKGYVCTPGDNSVCCQDQPPSVPTHFTPPNVYNPEATPYKAPFNPLKNSFRKSISTAYTIPVNPSVPM
jgi:hypothetical protein